ncbi:phosphoadenosine phosphosulfate reductase family protein [Flavonifractor plautii]|nr:phosphoadenosine phosphosulfate reductase family protein [Flavonifractor plautii]
MLLDLARRAFPDIPAVFVDTGLEYPEIREFVKTVPNVTWLRPEMPFSKVISEYGYPSFPRTWHGASATPEGAAHGRSAT